MAYQSINPFNGETLQSFPELTDACGVQNRFGRAAGRLSAG